MRDTLKNIKLQHRRKRKNEIFTLYKEWSSSRKKKALLSYCALEQKIICAWCVLSSYDFNERMKNLCRTLLSQILSLKNTDMIKVQVVYKGLKISLSSPLSFNSNKHHESHRCSLSSFCLRFFSSLIQCWIRCSMDTFQTYVRKKIYFNWRNHTVWI